MRDSSVRLIMQSISCDSRDEDVKENNTLTFLDLSSNLIEVQYN